MPSSTSSDTTVSSVWTVLNQGEDDTEGPVFDDSWKDAHGRSIQMTLKGWTFFGVIDHEILKTVDVWTATIPGSLAWDDFCIEASDYATKVWRNAHQNPDTRLKPGSGHALGFTDRRTAQFKATLWSEKAAGDEFFPDHIAEMIEQLATSELAQLTLRFRNVDGKEEYGGKFIRTSSRSAKSKPIWPLKTASDRAVFELLCNRVTACIEEKRAGRGHKAAKEPSY